MSKQKTIIHESEWLVRLVRPLPLWASYVEAVRVGMDVTSYVRVRVLGMDLGIWRDSASHARFDGR